MSAEAIEHIEGEPPQAEQPSEEQRNVIVAKELFKEIIEQQEEAAPEPTPPTPTESESSEEKEKKQRARGKRRYITVTDRTNSTLMLLALRRLKHAEEHSFQPDVRESIREAVLILKRIIEENEDIFPGVLKRKE